MSGILVVPFVGMLAEPPPLDVNDGRDRGGADVPGGAAGRRRSETVEIAREAGRIWQGFAYELEGHTIWGATGWMLHTLLEVIRKEASWLIPA